MSYCYEPLQPSLRQIRLLTLLPSVNGQINVRLNVVSLEERPVFNAVSYVWGEENDSEPIKINGQALVVRKNLMAVLRRLQDSESQAIWIDAICIDQQNPVEKNFQLPLMRAIYTQALRVLVWLGEGNPYIEALFQWVQHLDTDVFPRGTPRQHGRAEKAFIGYIDFYLLPYWQRMWTYQELAMPESDPICLYAGYRCNLSAIIEDDLDALSFQLRRDILGYELEFLDPAAYNVSDTMDIPDVLHSIKVASIKRGISGARKYSKRDELECSVSWLLFATIGRKCYDPRDRVYALYGMLDSFRLSFPADYGVNNPVERVLVSAAAWIVAREYGICESMFEMFGMHASRFAQSPSLPSWIPNFDIHHPQINAKKLAESLRQRSRMDIKPITHDRDISLIIGRPGVGVVATGEPKHTAIPASLEQFVEAIKSEQWLWNFMRGDHGTKSIEVDGGKGWMVVQLPAWEYDQPKVVTQNWDQGSDTSEHSHFHVAHFMLGDMPLLRISARNLGECSLFHTFGPNQFENQFYLALILWSLREDLSSWKLTIHELNQVQNYHENYVRLSLPPTAELEEAKCHKILSDCEDMMEFWEKLGGRGSMRLSSEPSAEESVLEQKLSLFVRTCANRMIGLSAFWVQVQGRVCLGLTADAVETGDHVILPLEPYRNPFLLRRENPNSATSKESCQEESLHGSWDELVYYRLVGIAFLQDLVDESDLVAGVAEQIVEDFYIR